MPRTHITSPVNTGDGYEVLVGQASEAILPNSAVCFMWKQRFRHASGSRESVISAPWQRRETAMSKSCILLMESGVVLEQRADKNGQPFLTKVYSVSTKRTSEVWQSASLEEALTRYNAELDRCVNLALHR